MSGPSLRESFPTWARIGFLSFGGPAGQIALMHRILVDEKKWLTEAQFLNALSFCMLLPGPEAMQLATYAGWRMQGWRGGLLAGLLFVIPGAFVIMALSIAYLLLGTAPLFAAIFLGVKAAVLAIVFQALLRMARKSLQGRLGWVLAALAFVALFAMQLPFPIVIIAAALAGALFTRSEAPIATSTPERPAIRQTLKTALLWAAIWILPLTLIPILTGSHLLGEIGWFFSKLAVVTFGGAYAVLAYMAQEAVTAKAWLTAPQMVDGLGMAETTPGPLILVTQYVGFMAGAAGGSMWAGMLAAVVTLWATFTPCFLWVFVGAPYIDWLGTKPRLRAALSGISAAVVGVIFNLSLWFGFQVLFDATRQWDWRLGHVSLPELVSANLIAFILAIIAGYLLVWRGWSVFAVLGVSAVLGAATQLI